MMKRIVFIIVSLFLSFKGICQPECRRWGFYVNNRVGSKLKNKNFTLAEKNNTLGIIIRNKWYRVSNKPVNCSDLFCMIVGTPSNIPDTVDVFTIDPYNEFKLILTPNVKKKLPNSLVCKSVHISHASHYSSKF